MAFRFRKSFTLAPGIRMSLSGGGTSFSFGPRGASVSVGKRGVFGNVGIPGTGLSARQKLSGSDSGGGAAYRQSSAVPQTVSVAISVGVRDDGEVYFENQAGEPLAEHMIRTARKQHGDTIAKLIQAKCDEVNAQIEAVGELHLDTPAPDDRPTFTATRFEINSPVCPAPKQPSFFGKFFRRSREKVEAENQRSLRQHEEAVAQWEREFESHSEAQATQRTLIEESIYTKGDAMESYLESTLQQIVWPRETNVSTEIASGGRVVFVDVDLPEIEDMPNKTAGIPKRGLKLSVKEMSDTQVKRLYMRHVHGIAFRIIGETFASLPLVEQVVLSGFSQRRDKGTGRLDDEYLYSVKVCRQAWRSIEFSPASLTELDVVEALSRFELRRAMTKTGIFKPITPFAIEDGVVGAAPL